MGKKHSNMGNANLPTYQTLKEIIVKGTEAGGDKRQYVFLDKNKKECIRSFNDTWAEMSALGTLFINKSLNGKKKIAIIGENCYEWMVAYGLTGSCILVRHCRCGVDGYRSCSRHIHKLAYRFEEASLLQRGGGSVYHASRVFLGSFP